MSHDAQPSTAKQRSFAELNQAIRQFAIDGVDFVVGHLESHRLSENPDNAAHELVNQLEELLLDLAARHPLETQSIVDEFQQVSLPEILSHCRHDFERYPIQDPALSNLEEVFFASNGFWATVAHRIAHALRTLGVPVIPRAISGFAHSRTGVDIHPGAKIGPGLFIDHGTGIAIGCTAVLKQNVSLYNGVVLGTRSKPTRTSNERSGHVAKRHPTIGAGVSLYTNAFVGGDVTVGENAIIGAYAFITRDVPAGAAIKGRSTSESASENQAPPALETTVPVKRSTRPCRSRPAVLSLIGNTPVVELRTLHDNPRVRIFAKLEGANPSGSVKDRIALSLIEQAEAAGKLTPGKVILESTSGNTGIGLAMVGAAKGYEVVLTMSAAMSEERKKVVRALGATLVETDPSKGTGGAIEVARQMFADEPDKYWMSRQHSSLDNPLAHYQETAEEILRQVPDVTHFVAGIGTFGTLRGAGGRLREAAGVNVIGIEPVLGQAIQGLRNMKEPNPPALYDAAFLDEKRMAMAETAYATTRLLAEKEGLLVGMSSGAAMYGALEVAQTIDQGVIVVLFPDRGEKYLSTSLFDKPQPARANAMSNATDDQRAWLYQI
ncbi:MAG: pyridoxal-phosphate dependent enzyme [Planctomycetota bacterium]